MRWRAAGWAGAVCAVSLAAAGARAAEVPAPQLEGVEPRVRQALVAAQRLVEARPRDAGAWGAYGMALDAHRQTAQAGTAYREAHRLDPGEFRWAYFLAGLLQYSDPAEAVGFYRLAVEIDPGYAPARVRYGETLETLGRMEEAESQFREATRLAPDDPLGWFGVGRSELARGRVEPAVANLERAYRLDHGIQAVVATLSRALFRAGQGERARALAGEARGLPRMTHHRDPRRAAVRALAVDAESYLQRSRTYQEVGQLDRSLAELETLANLEPDRADVHFAMAGILDRMRRPQEAQAAARRALELEPDRTDARAVLAGSLLKLERFGEAGVEARRVLAREPQNFHMLLVAGMAEARSGDVVSAVEQIDRAWEARTGDSELRSLLRRLLIDFGESFVAIGARQEGLRRLERALVLDREDAAAGGEAARLERRIAELRAEG
ncbi:MAG TPA: tetratricopeptide repeat protein [Thermoanaerobaculia bacterium]|nr:tetratricopeptide repeat protein [Thermoanaerobaculia bacterium]